MGGGLAHGIDAKASGASARRVPVPKAFLIAPFTAASAGGEAENTYSAVQLAIRHAADQVGLDLVRADDIFQAGVVIEQIRGQIELADIVIAICTGRNANVFYELAIAEENGHLPILVAATSEDLPFDVAHMRAQLYAEGDLTIESLSDRVARALQATLELRPNAAYRPSRTISMPTSPATPVSLVEAGNKVGYMEEAKRLIDGAVAAHKTIGEANFDVQPSEEAMEGFAALRYEWASSILDFLAPAIEYDVALLNRPLRIIAETFHTSIRPGSGGSTFWLAIHQTWSSRILRGALAIALGNESFEAIRMVLGLPPVSLERRRDDSPLLLNPSFVWPEGYAGNSTFAFRDLLKLADSSRAIASATPMGRRPRDLIIGEDLAAGLARVFLEDGGAENIVRRGDGTPYWYSGFAEFDCPQFAWMARRIETSQELAMALGAKDLSSARILARGAYPKLTRLHERRNWGMLCDTWEDTITYSL